MKKCCQLSIIEGIKIARDEIEKLRLNSMEKPTFYEDALMDSWDMLDTLMKKWKKTK